MAKGDIGRLMEPLFLTLLDPSTARVSVLHAKIEHMDTVDGGQETGLKKSHRIYSIGYGNREVIYHVSVEGQRDDDRNGESGADRAKRIFALNK